MLCWIVACDLLVVLCLSAVLLIRYKFGHKFGGWESFETLLFRHTYLWITLSTTDVAFILLYIFALTKKIQKDIRYQVCAMLILCILLFISNSVFLAIATASRERLEKANRILGDCHTWQREYYQALLDQEQETRKYRHDMKNHFLCMESLAQHNKFQDLKDYIRRISKNISDTNLTYRTGNDIFDILLHEYSGRCKKEGIAFYVTGTVTREILIPFDDLCILFSNLITNACEAARKAEDARNRKVLVNIAQGHQYLGLSTGNYLKGREITLDTPTTKQDARNHGFGLKNIRRIAEKYGGKVTFTTKGDWLEIQVFIEIP